MRARKDGTFRWPPAAFVAQYTDDGVDQDGSRGIHLRILVQILMQ